MELSVFSQSKPVSKDDSKKPFEVLNTDKLSILNLKQVVMFFMVFVALNKPEAGCDVLHGLCGTQQT